MKTDIEQKYEDAKIEIMQLETKLNSALAALGYPVPGNTPEGVYKCGLCANKEKDYQLSKVEQQTLWKAFRMLAEAR